MQPSLLKKLEKSNQQQLLTFWDSLSLPQRESLTRQIDSIDLELIQMLYENRDKTIDMANRISQAKEPPFYTLGSDVNAIKKTDAIQSGKAELAAGKVAALVVAGGQGTRLGFEHPKGMYPIGPVNRTTLFQIHIEKALAKARQFGKPFPFCVMTSPVTHKETVEFLEKNNRFGLPKEDLYIFSQGTMPAVSLEDGKILLAAPDEIAFSPDGHGGMLKAIDQSGTLRELADRGIEQLFYFQVDNPLVDIGNEEFLGYHTLTGSELSSQVVRKTDPGERVGNIISIDDRLHVIEYSDLPDEIANRRKSDGSLEVWAGSIAVHIMNIAFLQKQALATDSLPFHIAKKKVSYVDESGNLQKPSSPNAIKFERFIFDLLPGAENAIVVEVDARDHFAPLKNASGASTDSPEWVRDQMSRFHTHWLKTVGAEVDPGVMVEISPLFANSAEELAEKMQPGTKITQNRYFSNPYCPKG